jgi:hypothetical protein
MRAGWLLPGNTRRGLLVILVCGVAMLAAGCGRKPAASPPPGRSAPPRASANSPAAQDLTTAKQAAVHYLDALYAQDFRTAYDLLSADSKRQHPEPAFKRSAAENQIQYEINGAAAEAGVRGSVRVAFDLDESEEPGSNALTLVKEQGKWRVVFEGGTPYYPYAGEREEAPAPGE